MTTKAAAHYVRGELATALRKRPYSTNLLVAGHDPPNDVAGTPGGPALYWIDYLATCHPMNVAGTGYGSYFVLAMLDALWRPGLTEAEALALMERGIDEVVKRLVVAPSAYVIKVVDKDGVRVVKTVRPGSVSGGGGGGEAGAGAVAAAVGA
jgi:20S proteasome subunit beta 4